MSRASWLLRLAAWAARCLPSGIKQALYRTPLAPFIRRSLNRAAPQGLTVVEVAGGGLAGYRLLLNLQQEKYYWLGTHELDLQAVVKELAQPGMVAYDVGANIGFFTLLLARQVGAQGQVYAFEPLPANLERIRANLELNDNTNLVHIVEAAVVETERPLTFWIGLSPSTGRVEGSANRERPDLGQKIEVRGLSLDHFVYEQGHPPPHLVKMDIEGGEVLALPGMRRLLREARPLLLLELHGWRSLEVAWEVLTEAGYRLCRMTCGFPPVASWKDLNPHAYVVAFPPNK